MPQATIIVMKPGRTCSLEEVAHEHHQIRLAHNFCATFHSQCCLPFSYKHQNIGMLPPLSNPVEFFSGIAGRAKKAQQTNIVLGKPIAIAAREKSGQNAFLARSVLFTTL